MKIKNIVLFLITSLVLGCSSDDNNEGPDQEKPVIDMSIAGGFPTSCSTIKRGETINFKALFTDNRALGAYSINIHHNFDHHSHDTEIDECSMDAKKTPVNPLSKTYTFTIPTNQNEFTAEQQIVIPADIDAGDYHFMVQLTDAEGWATMRGISIKILP